MNWKILFLATVVVISGCTTFTGPKEETVTSSESPEAATSGASDIQPSELPDNTTTVYFTDSGFQPSSITVEEGTTVTWINNASKTMWVGSNRHPTHRQYAGNSLAEHCEAGDQNMAAFDQCTTGDRFSFTFEKTGTWGYHNHQPFERGGTVTVR
ncbi:plastocyanin/azurin family copper-binding protein [Candidatus Nanohalococcus occultus]|uniref:cupredoxin domain-containing protein n=1 Tax=Candidatus Nanohalococcus occultus TaxID=2978047 RepID=UPI0039E16B4D